MNPPIDSSAPARRRAFTLIEVLTVVALIGIIGTIVMPMAQAIRVKAIRAKTRAQLSQWALAMEMFNAEYGSYPKIDGSYAGGRSGPDGLVNGEKFSVALSGRKLDGDDTALRNANPSSRGQLTVGNTRLITFYSPAQGEINLEDTPPSLVDYFGNKEIGVIYDKNGDGIINRNDVTTLQPVSAKIGGKYTPDTTTDINLTLGVHSPVIFYSPGAGDSTGQEIEAADAVFSWK
jgi:prepilin-type N-terminal cleavage/methylation domain-containing protein